MKCTIKSVIVLCVVLLVMSCEPKNRLTTIEVYQTSEQGDSFKKLSDFGANSAIDSIVVQTDKTYQTITGFGGAFTESSAYLLNQLSKANRDKILKAYFSENGANYSLTRTHMNSCDFSLNQYSYAPTPDKALKDFSVKEDMDDLIPMIKHAMAISKDGFKILASPWTAPPWMKDNNHWVGGKLLPEYYDTWALFFSKYYDAYKAEGIDIWGFTVENEPNGNGNNWESMHYSPAEMTNFVVNHLSPKLDAEGKNHIVILGYDQNRDDLKNWVDDMYQNDETAKHFDGTAIHWYDSTFKVFEDELQYAHNKAPNKYLIETEGCIDDEVPVWKDDKWYWKKEATDWGYRWAKEEHKHWHPKYAPVNRYARDIIGCLNNWVDGWIDWNMVLDRQGGPNWFKNWCIAPVIVDPDNDEVYFTPLYYVMTHFSKFIRPGAKVVEVTLTNKELIATAAINPDQSKVIVVFNEGQTPKQFNLVVDGQTKALQIDAQALQSIRIPTNKK